MLTISAKVRTDVRIKIGAYGCRYRNPSHALNSRVYISKCAWEKWNTGSSHGLTRFHVYIFNRVSLRRTFCRRECSAMPLEKESWHFGWDFFSVISSCDSTGVLLIMSCCALALFVAQRVASLHALRKWWRNASISTRQEDSSTTQKDSKRHNYLLQK